MEKQCEECDKMYDVQESNACDPHIFCSSECEENRNEFMTLLKEEYRRGQMDDWDYSMNA